MRIAVCGGGGGPSSLPGLIEEYQLSRGENIDCRVFNNSTDFLCDLKGGEYDLVFLDALTPGDGGIQAAQELRETDKNARLIVVSAAPEMAVESYRVGAYHFLLKPAGADALFPLLDRAKREMAAEEREGFVIKSREGVARIPFAGLEYVEVLNKTVLFYMADGAVYEASAALSDFEGKLLSRPDFLKTHRSCLVNLNYVRELGPHCAVTKNGRSIPVSRQRRGQARDAWLRFVRQTEEGVSAPSGESRERPGGPWRILLVDDEPAESAVWAEILRSHGCIVETAKDSREALRLAAREMFDCVLLDVMIPGEDGFSICERLCRQRNTPVIFLSCLTEADKQVAGFAAGGIDYITKNTPADLFWAKVQTRIRLSVSGRAQFFNGPLLLDLSKRRARLGGGELSLTQVEFDILWRLSEQPGYIFTPEELFGLLWGDQPWDGGQAVQRHMSRLRGKLEKAWGEHHFIESVWGRGYRFVPADD